jgi:tetratricopeptide (TPR) repeat protein
VANNQALPTIKEQLIKFSRHINTFKPIWERTTDELKKSIKGVLQPVEIFKLVAGNLFPFADVAISILQPLVQPSENATPLALPDQLTELLHIWFNSTDATPIILWLDDVQWIDKEATEFFTELMRITRTKRWPLLLVATSWPAEWNQFSNDFFLKHDTATTMHLSNAADTELRALLHAAFPQLPPDQTALIVHKAGGNFLNMIENITELHGNPDYFVDSSPTQLLALKGMTNILKWESGRQNRIAQRFHGFDNHIKKFLARASQAGLNTQFLQRVLVRCRDIYPDEAHVLELLNQCQASLAIIMPTTSHVNEFRDRGYFAVAQQHFVAWLADNDTNTLHTALVAELTERVQSAFDDNGDLCKPQTHSTSLRATTSKEQAIIYTLAMKLLPPLPPLPPHTDTAIRTRIAYTFFLMETQALADLRKHIVSFSTPDWETVLQNTVISTTTLRQIADICYIVGSLQQATSLYTILESHQNAKFNEDPNIVNTRVFINILIDARRPFIYTGAYRKAEEMCQKAYQLASNVRTQPGLDDNVRWEFTQLCADVLNSLGDIYLKQSQYTRAQDYFEQDCELCSLLVNERNHLDDIRNLSIAYATVGNCAVSIGDNTRALDYYVQSIALKRQLITQRGTLDDYRILAVTFMRIGRVYAETGQIDAEYQAYQEAIDIARHVQSLLNLPNEQTTYISALNAFSRVLYKQNQLNQAYTYAQESLQLCRNLVEDSGTPYDTLKLVVTLILIGRIAQRQDKAMDALSYFDESVTLSAELVKIIDTPDFQFEYAIALNYIGKCHLEMADVQSAIQCFTKAFDILHKHSANQHPKWRRLFVSVQNNLGKTCLQLDNQSQAYEHWHTALNVCNQLISSHQLHTDKISQLRLQFNICCLSDMFEAHQNDTLHILQKSIDEYTQMKHLLYTSTISDDLIPALFQLSKLYHQKNNTPNALHYALTARDLQQDIPTKLISADQLNSWVQLLESQNQ